MKWIGLGELRKLNRDNLRGLSEPIEVLVGTKSEQREILAILIPYSLYLQWSELSQKIDELERKLEED